MTELLFYANAYMKDCEAEVVTADERGIVLDRTVFYPLGGGQPGDVGSPPLPDPLPPEGGEGEIDANGRSGDRPYFHGHRTRIYPLILRISAVRGTRFGNTSFSFCRISRRSFSVAGQSMQASVTDTPYLSCFRSAGMD